jgi:hypothetical protein
VEVEVGADGHASAPISGAAAAAPPVGAATQQLRTTLITDPQQYQHAQHYLRTPSTHLFLLETRHQRMLQLAFFATRNKLILKLSTHKQEI